MAALARHEFAVQALCGPAIGSQTPDDPSRAEFLRIFDATVSEFRPDVLVAYGCGGPVGDAVASARALGIVIVFAFQDFNVHDVTRLADSDAVLVPSGVLAQYYDVAAGVACTVLPIPIDEPQSAGCDGTGYVTLVDPTIANGAYVFARIADELGRARPDIPLLVVEGEASEATLAACGLDLRGHGNVNLMPPPADARRIWAVSRVALMPSLGWADRSSVVAAAFANGIPVIASDRAGLTEALGGAGMVLPLPGRLTPATRMLPTAEEVGPWVREIIRLWDDANHFAEHRRRALAEAGRWSPEILGPKYARFFTGLRPGSKTARPRSPGRSKAVVLVPHLSGVEWECEQGLQRLERAGVRVVRMGGSSAIDLARCVLASDVLHDGFETILFIDADLGFDASDALRLLARPEPVIAGIYVKKARRELASIFAEGITEVIFGPEAKGLYPLKYAATGFLRIRACVLQRMIEELELPLCNARWSRGLWPFFQPLTVPLDDGQMHYLSEDWAFSHRLSQLGITPLADTSIRLWHYGRYGFGWEDAGADSPRHSSYIYRSL